MDAVGSHAVTDLEQRLLVRDLEHDEIIDRGRISASVLAAFESGMRSLDKLLR